MKNDLIGFLENARKNRPEKFRTHFSIFLSCLGISIFLWLLVHLSKDYPVDMEYRLHYREIPSSMRLAGYSDSTINVTVRVQGFEFFTEGFLANDIHDVTISLRGIKIKPDNDQYSGYLLTRNISPVIAAASQYPHEIFTISPDTIFFTFERKILKKPLPVKSWEPGNQKSQAGPDSLKVRTDTTGSHPGTGNRKHDKPQS